MIASPGHRLGQIIGNIMEDVFKETVARLAREFGLYHDSKGTVRPARGTRKIIWRDAQGNAYDMDHVLEQDGSDDRIGEPIGFIEVFWRRYEKHSRNKAKEDTGKLVPLLSSYPSARFAAIIAAGVFTPPAIQEVESKGIKLLHIPVDVVFDVFRRSGVEVDYPEKADDDTKRQLLWDAERMLTDSLQAQIKSHLLQEIADDLTQFIEVLRQELARTIVTVTVTREASSSFTCASREEALAILSTWDWGQAGQTSEQYAVNVIFNTGTTVHRSFASEDELTLYLAALE